MRLYFLLIFVSVLMAFATGYYALFIQGTYTVTEEDIYDIREIKRKFHFNNKPLVILNFNAIYSSPEHFELLRPLTSFKNTFSSVKQQTSHVYMTDKHCFKELNTLLNSQDNEKAIMWEEFRCSRRKILPRRYFSTPPYMHPSGASYSYLAYKLGKYPYNSMKWFERALPYIHISELRELKKVNENLPSSIYDYLTKLDADTINGIVKGATTFISNDFYVEKNKDVFIFFDLEYNIYSLKSFQKFIENTPYYVKKFENGKKCFFKDGHICWEYNLSHVLSLTNKRNIFVIITSVLLILLLIYLLYTKLMAQKIEDNRRRLALQVLTHEFRTPVASLLLSTINIQKNLTQHDEETQDLILRISSDVHRLHRLVEASRNYLKLVKGKKLISFKNKKIDSINDFISDVVEPYLSEINVHLLKQDDTFFIDEYWLSICMKNLIENALSHGEKPIDIYIEKRDEILIFAVKDNGHCDFKSLKELTSEFVKGNKSQGTGLGLNIVDKVLKDMGGELSYSQNPTVFQISIKSKKEQRA